MERGRLDAPTLPVRLGTIALDDSPVINLRFDLRGLVPSSTLRLEVEGRYVDPREADDLRDHDGDRDRRLVDSSKSTDCLVGCLQNVRCSEWGPPCRRNPRPRIN